MKKASIAVALVLVLGLFAAAFSLSPEYLTPVSAQNATTPTANVTAPTANVTAPTANVTAPTANVTAPTANVTGSSFTAKGSIASLVFDTGQAISATTGANQSAPSPSSANATKATISNATSAATAGNKTTGTANATTTGPSLSTNATTAAQPPGLPYILSGNWSIDVKNGQVANFMASFTMVHTDGSGRHTHDVTNFKSASGSTITLNPTGTTYIFGKADVSLNGQVKWAGANALITIEHINASSLSFASSDTDNHFKEQPIYGVVNSLKDQNGNELVKTAAPTGVTTTPTANVTAPTANVTAPTANVTGAFAGNVSQGLSKLFPNATSNTTK